MKIRRCDTDAIIYEHNGTLREAVEAAVRGKVPLAGADLRRANLADANLTGANLADADLTGAINLRR